MKSVRKVVRCPGKRPPEKPYGVDQTEERRKEERRGEGKGGAGETWNAGTGLPQWRQQNSLK